MNMKSSKRIISSLGVTHGQGGGGNFDFPSRLNITVLFAAALFLAAAFFVTYAEPNESDAAVTGTGTFDDPWYCGPDGSSSVTATLINGVLTISSSGAMDNYTHTSGVVNTPWWNEKESIVSAVIEEGVTSIGIRAFYNCTNLTSINIPDSVTEIGDAAFYLCIKLTSINIPDGVTQIGDTAFYLCSRLTSVVMPDSMISIGASAFQACASLESVVIDSVTSIGNYAFQGCTKLESVEILGNMLTSIGDNAFNGCSNLTFVAMSGNLKTIGSSAFNGCSNLTFVAMSGNLKTIGSRAFNGCSNLTSIVIPDGVETIGDRAFYNCTKLESVEILGNTLKTIGDNAFQGCTKLISIIIPDKVTSIGGYAFYKCTSLESIVIPGSVKTIGTTVFFECTSLTSVVIPDSVTTIGTQAFQNCTALTTVTVTGGSGGNITADGIIDKYFKNGKGWKLPGANYAAKYLILPDISSGDYASTNIAAYAGRELHYSDKVYTASGSSWTESTSLYTVSGTVKDSDSAGIEGAKVSLGTNGVYTALTDADGKYTIANVPADTYNITVTKAGYVTGTISSVTVSSSDVTGKDISLNVSKYTVSGTVTAGGNSVPSNVTVSYTSDNSSFSSGNVTTDGSGKYTISDIPHGTSLSITVA
ncbi:MAG: leucine-rich repeat protein, partial [Candidatus Methanoplasma sp.]|nr:leucine-rich repeat protein [Candidatus Methanoplasma sp.]